MSIDIERPWWRVVADHLVRPPLNNLGRPVDPGEVHALPGGRRFLWTPAGRLVGVDAGRSGANWWLTVGQVDVVPDGGCAPTDPPSAMGPHALAALDLALAPAGDCAELVRGHVYSFSKQLVYTDAAVVAQLYMGTINVLQRFADGRVEHRAGMGWLDLAELRQVNHHGDLEVSLSSEVDCLAAGVVTDDLARAMEIHPEWLSRQGRLGDHGVLLDGDWFAEHPVLLGRFGQSVVTDRSAVTWFPEAGLSADTAAALLELGGGA